MTPDDALRKYKQAGVLVDTNLLLLYFVGAADPEQIPRFKRTRQFTVDDHGLLVRILGFFDRVVTTPHILAEVSNLAGQLTEPLRQHVFERFALGIRLLQERYTSATVLASGPVWTRFGATDAAVFHEARNQLLVLTDDFRLSQYLQHEGVDVLNFNHLRMGNLM